MSQKTLIIGAILCSFAFGAQAEDRVLQNPPLLPQMTPAPEQLELFGDQTLLTPPPVPADEAGDITYDLSVEYIDTQLWNPATNRHDKVRLRGYRGTGMDPNAPLISPSIEMRPGQTVYMNLRNQLPIDRSCEHQDDQDINIPHCFNGTNMHTHGLWINPAGNSDNVLISVNPGVDFTYEYNVPADHPSGTFWYHPHRHGSTALQVSSGMSGALIIRGDRVPTLAPNHNQSSNADMGNHIINGDIDVILKPAEDGQFKERIMVFQQIAYACLREDATILMASEDGPWICEPDQVGVIENYDGFGPGNWEDSGRYTSINGQVLPVLKAKAGMIERWRMIHAGVRDTIGLTLVKAKGDIDVNKAVPANNQEDFVAANCGEDLLNYHTIAADGLTMAAANRVDTAVFQPGYRWDALMSFPEPGVYCLIDAEVGGRTIDGGAPSPAIMGYVVVEPGADVANDVTDHVKAALVAAAKTNLPADTPEQQLVQGQIVKDLEDGMKFTNFEPHRSLMGLAPYDLGQQTLHFNIDVSGPGGAVFEVDGEPFQPDRIDRTLELGAIDQWEIYSDFVSHPFHIHVNPFQIVAIYDPNGKDVSAPGAVDDFYIPDPDNPDFVPKPDKNFPGLKGVWKDTLWIKNVLATNNPAEFPKGQYKIVVRTHYQRYIGDFVLHCHILDHEDQGMMQHIRIALADGQGGVTMGAHGGHSDH